MTLPTTAVGLARAIRERQVSPVEVARHYLDVIDRKNPQLNAIIWRRDEEFLQEAATAEAAVLKGEPLAPFHGVPIAIKDLTEVLGQPATHASMAAMGKVGRFDATVVSLIRRAGFLQVGRTNSPEFGTLPVTENQLYGPTRNPWDTALTPGGSSGGAAAAVAAGMLPIAHASDGGGSIRIPASCCGLVGLKAARMRIPKGPVLSEILHGFSTDGCVSTSVEDTAHMLDALCSYDPTAWYSVALPAVPYAESYRRDPGRLRIGYTTKGPVQVPVDPECVRALEIAAEALVAQGHEVFAADVKWPCDSEQLARDFIGVWCTLAAYVDFEDWSKVEPLNRNLRRMAQGLSTVEYIQTVMRLQVFSRNVVKMWGRDFDLLLTPTMAMTPPPVGWLFEEDISDPMKFLLRCTEMVPFTGWCNVTGQPAISLPMHVSPAGVPIGVQLIAPPFREDLLLQVSRQIEADFVRPALS